MRKQSIFSPESYQRPLCSPYSVTKACKICNLLKMIAITRHLQGEVRIALCTACYKRGRTDRLAMSVAQLLGKLCLTMTNRGD